jgi:hypothetical protein
VQAKGSRSVLKSVNDSASAMKSTATDLFAASEQTSQRAYGMVRASNEASMNVGNAANATDELSASITEISRQTIDVVLTAVNKAKAMSDRFAGLVRAAQMIGEVVKLIQQIAAQTNLLALNASGSAGRRSRTRLCGGGFRGEIARFANGQCDERDRGRDSGSAKLNHGSGRYHPQHRGVRRADQFICIGYRRFGRATGEGDPGNFA